MPDLQTACRPPGQAPLRLAGEQVGSASTKGARTGAPGLARCWSALLPQEILFRASRFAFPQHFPTGGSQVRKCIAGASGGHATPRSPRNPTSPAHGVPASTGEPARPHARQEGPRISSPAVPRWEFLPSSCHAVCLVFLLAAHGITPGLACIPRVTSFVALGPFILCFLLFCVLCFFSVDAQ